MSSGAEKSLDSHIPTLLRMWHPKTNRLSFRELKDVSASLLSLQRGLTGNRKLSGAGYMEDVNYLGAYLLYYWPVSFLQISYAAQSDRSFFTELVKTKNEIRILDLGSGPGPATCALADILTKINPGIKIDATLVDSSTKAVSLAVRIIKADFNNVSVKAETFNFEKKNYVPEGKYDVIIMSHALNELWKSESNCLDKREAFLEKVTTMLTEDGILFLNEPAMLESSRNLIALRDRLIAKGLYVHAPCTACSECPAFKAGENQTCHAEVMWNPIEPVASIAREAKLDRESVKMTYFIMSKKPSCEEEEDRSEDFRIVSDGMLNKAGRVRYLLCNGTERIPFSAKKDEEHAKKIGFFNLKRYDRVSVSDPELRGDKDNKAYGVAESTSIGIYKFVK